MVFHANVAEKDTDRQLDCLITHPSIVRCLFDYVYIALKGQGKIIIADAPVQSCNFEILLRNSGYGELFRYFKGKETKDLSIDCADLRDTILLYLDNGNMKQYENKRKKYAGVIVDLGKRSYFYDIKKKKKLMSYKLRRQKIPWHIILEGRMNIV